MPGLCVRGEVHEQDKYRKHDALLIEI